MKNKIPKDTNEFTTVIDKIDGIIFDLPLEQKLLLWELIMKVDFSQEKEVEKKHPINIAFDSIFEIKKIKEEFAKEGFKRASQNNLNQAEAGYNAKWFKRGALFGYQKAIKEFIQSPEPVKINKKCECKRATFTRTVDADFNCLCGKCGHPI